MRNIYRWLFMCASVMLSTQMTLGQISTYPHTEGFEGSFNLGTDVEFLPNWFGSIVNGDTIFQETVYVRTGSAALGFTPPAEEFVLYASANLDLTGVNNPFVEFWAASKSTGGQKSVRLYVSLSKDGGLTWLPEIQIGDNVTFPNEDTPFNKYTYGFHPDVINEANVKFRFTVKGGIKKEPVAQLIIDDVTFDASDTDIFPPLATSLSIISPDTLRLLFSEPVNETAEVISNYLFTPALSISAIERVPTLDTVYFYLSEPLLNGIEYALVVQNVEDVAGNVMTTQEFELIYSATISGLVVSEIFYDEPPVEMNDNLEYIELYNATTAPLALGGIQIKEAIFSGPLPAYMLQPGEYYILAKNSATFNSVFGFNPNFEWTASNLENTGNEYIQVNPADHHAGFLLDSVVYQITEPWPIEAAGTGRSIEICNKFGDNADGANWQASSDEAGTINGFTIWATPGKGCDNSLNPVVSLGDDTDYCGIAAVTLNAGNEGALYLWSTGETTQEILVTESGLYSVILNNGYGVGEDEITVNLYDAIIASATLPASPQCSNEALTFTDNTVDAVSWLWSFGDGTTSTLQNPNHTYLSAGTFDVTLLVTSAVGCTDVFEGQIEIISIEPTWTVPENPVCVDEEINFTSGTSTDVEPVSLLWDFGDGTTSTEQNPSHTYSEIGFYDISLLAISDQGCTNTLTAEIHVTRVTSDFNAPQTKLCANVAHQFQSNVANAFAWNWDFGDGNTSEDENPEHAYANAGTYMVSLRVTTQYGCTDELSQEVEVADIEAEWTFPESKLCANVATAFQANTANATGWNWNFGDGITSQAQNSQHTYAAVGTYTVTLQITSQYGCQDEITGTVEVSDITATWTLPEEAVCYQSMVNFQSTNQEAVSSSWSFGDGGMSGNHNSEHAFTEPGMHTVTLTVVNAYGCEDDIETQVDVAVCLGTDRDLDNYLTVYPNPGSGSFKIDLNQHLGEPIDVQVYNQEGKLIYSYQNQTPGFEQNVVEVQNLNTGLYILKLRVGDNQIDRKIIIQ